MDDEQTFSLSYAQITAITEQYIRECIRNAGNAGSREEAITETDWARASLDHWHLLARACGAAERTVAEDRQRMTDLIWCYPSEEDQC
ncbi:hypothetical protein NQ468_001946 [Salmonella enterica]|nr:hypothetical protein [Salmonella enterica subsp. enterica serovar Poona]EJO0601668.1 hypothetical protein [Salmonella enterica]HCZ4969889.1 hypothetical protein [Salmonella enterica subsp. enterica serovar Saintpaul str. CFSAN004160]HCZ4970471.1 hypothetical protein [Salmonella enterica subsp. enterica serovar Saintpaul str. CFSAN004160]